MFLTQNVSEQLVNFSTLEWQVTTSLLVASRHYVCRIPYRNCLLTVVYCKLPYLADPTAYFYTYFLEIIEINFIVKLQR